MTTTRARPAIQLALALALALSSAGGCPEEEPLPPEPARLADPAAWTRVVDPGRDVFAASRPADATCDDAGYFVDPLTLTFEVQTDLCDYLTVAQPTLEPLAVGDVVEVRAFHYALTAPTPAEGYLALALDGAIIWEASAPIPSDAGPLGGEVTITRALPAGAELQLHVHNHGPNTWELLSLMVTPAS